jgi:intracellular sulfur oxidation DsrE/DsrF family protein
VRAQERIRSAADDFGRKERRVKKMNPFVKGKIMKRPLLKSSVGLAAVLICISSWSFAWEYPVIKGYGPVDPLPSAAFQPDKSIKYRVLFDITKAAETVDKVNPGLDRVARFLNVMAASNIMPRDMELAAVIHGPAAPSVLKNEIFKKRFKMDNPNEKIIRSLKEAGVKLFVCGQTLADDGFKDKWVNEEIAIAVSALVVVPTYQLKGYAYLPLF